MPTFTGASSSGRASGGRHPGAYGTGALRTSDRSVRGRHLAGLLVFLDSLLEVAILRAAQHAERVEPGQVFLGLGQVAQDQVGLADVLVGAPALGVDRQRLLVERQRSGGIAVAPGG